MYTVHKFYGGRWSGKIGAGWWCDQHNTSAYLVIDNPAPDAITFHRSADSIIFLIPNGNLVARGDSVRVSSLKNTIQFFRDGKQVATDQLSNTLTGFGRPFFLKRK